MDEDPNKTKKYKIIILGLLIHLLLLFAVFDVYFASPLDHGMPSIKSTDSPPAKRLVLFVADGLRAEAIFGEHHQERAPYLTNILKNYGSWGVVHTRVPTESRPGHVAMLAGIYEDPSAILKGWKSNPVHFDSVINQSINAWAWGSPDIINIFNKDHSSRVHLHAYGAEMEDFGQSDTSALDTWVFQKVVEFLHNNVLQCNNNCETYHSSGNLFFLHLLGIDTAGHGFKPHSEQYKSNIQLVDASIRDMVTQLETVYLDKSTAYVFTSDHGMTDWGSHGAGSLHETEAPIIAWGAGIKRNSGRQDINQIDIAPLLASLIGINIPTNSLGFLPTGYLDTDLGNLAKMVLSNTLQVFEIFNVKRARIRNTALVFLPFQDERHKSPEEEVQKLKLLLVRGKYKDLIAECERFRMHLIDGVTYYHNYYNYPVLVSVSAGFLMWITFLGLTISSQTKLTSPSTHRKTLLPTVLIITAGLLCYKSNFPPTYYLYFTFPIAMYFTTFPDGRISNTLLKISSSSSNPQVFPTSYPSNQAELQLYRVMQNASLLLYYDTLLEMGGDDVQQLCDAGEEEFLEIMSLVGMASKPLHVRRLQKSLQEWVTNPTKFKIPLVPGEDFEIELSSPRVTSNHVFYTDSGDSSRTMYSPSPGDFCALPPVSSPGLSLSNKRPYSPLDPACPPSSSSSPSGGMSVQMSPSLMESQIVKLAAAAERLSKQLPQFEPKPHNTKKKVCKELELVMSMPENDPRRMDEIRRYAAIYGRFDCKRKPEKPLTLHEVSVNEAAAQICRFIPALLTRRDELFPLARQVVKDSGCYYSKTQLSTVYMNKHMNMGHDREAENNMSSRASPRISGSECDGPVLKRPKLESNSDCDDLRQVSQITRQKPHTRSHVYINLED